MTITAKQMVAPQQLTNADALYYTAPTNTTGVIKRATFTNTSAGAVTITANIVPPAGSSSAANRVIDPQNTVLSAGQTYVAPELAGKTMPAGTMLRMLASAASAITVAVDGVEIV
jgi:voltage-gated potassium channel Kch